MPPMLEVEITKLVHGGQGLGSLPDGRKVFVWGALPGERVRVRLAKTKRSYAEAIVEEVMTPSSLRIPPREPNYLATSPWQIVQFSAENDYKKRIVEELFVQAHVELPEFTLTAAGDEWHYRNKMEYSFWGDDAGLHLALHNRSSHQKIVVEGSELALPAIDTAAHALVAELQRHEVRAGDLKTLIVRCNQSGQAVAALFVKTNDFLEVPLPHELQGMRVYYSDPRSPASVATRLLYEDGDVRLKDMLLGNSFTYDVNSFFQVNLPVFEKALQQIRQQCDQADDVIDMYAGVGSIGLSIATQAVTLVELDAATVAMARINAASSKLQATVIEASTEKSLEYIRQDAPVIFDPPRAGLHDRVSERLLTVLPPQIVYLSCNPATQARDLAKLQQQYTIASFEAFNFFPHTPHIETLAVLKRKKQQGSE